MLEDLKSLRRMFPEMSRMQTTRTFSDCMSVLEMFARLGAVAYLRKDGSTLIGMTIFIPLQNIELGRHFANELDLDPKEAVLQTMVFVATSHRGNGLSHDLKKGAIEGVRSIGKRHIVMYGYETPEIISWFYSQAGYEDSGLRDAQDDPVFHFKL